MITERNHLIICVNHTQDMMIACTEVGVLPTILWLSQLTISLTEVVIDRKENNLWRLDLANYLQNGGIWQ